MKVLVVLSALAAFAAAAALSPAELQLLLDYDSDSLLANDEQAELVFNCMLEKVECGPYKQVADLSMKLMIHQCAECSTPHKIKYDSGLKQLHDKHEPLYHELMKKVAAKKE